MNVSLFGGRVMARGEWEAQMMIKVVAAVGAVDRLRAAEPMALAVAVGSRDALAESLGLMIGLSADAVLRAAVSSGEQGWDFLCALGSEQTAAGITGAVGQGW